MRARILITLVYAIALGVWAYGEKKEGAFLNTDAAALCALLLAVGVGISARRSWVLLALAGPLLSLGYLQATGYVSPDEDGASPLLSPPGISTFIWFGLLLLLGVWLGNIWERRRGRKVPTGRYG
jgi:hypothetical protein